MDASQPLTLKRQRSKNWTNSELALLIEGVQSKKNVLFSSFSNNLTNRMKKKAWEDISQSISANSGVKRLTKDVKKKWMDYKSQTRKKEAERRREATRTGGGPPPSSLTEMEQRVVSFIPPCSIQGCEGGLESEEYENTTPATPVFPETLQALQDLPCDGAFVPPTYIMYSESVMSADDVPQVDAVSHVKATKTLSDKDNILNIEREKLNVLKELLEVEKKRLHVEEQKLAYIISLEAGHSGQLNVSPVIQFL
ncbi:myb/SANT-like DNA-binding domain-containing protein 4 [Haliotis rufescens]|uniref:myb/SANT-like DNA-binding domain-containing protein 4 n=1 Tax=Haliotis rufescens TaxID=6454 RepID=UPI00201F49F7|nr:myb/SANT-like DNA-binding domain-containing protein 4 [Haliotis rufescens]